MAVRIHTGVTRLGGVFLEVYNSKSDCCAGVEMTPIEVVALMADLNQQIKIAQRILLLPLPIAMEDGGRA